MLRHDIAYAMPRYASLARDGMSAARFALMAKRCFTPRSRYARHVYASADERLPRHATPLPCRRAAVEA